MVRRPNVLGYLDWLWSVPRPRLISASNKKKKTKSKQPRCCGILLGGICHGLNLSQIVKWTFKQHTIVLWSGFEKSGQQILASQLFVFPHWGISSCGLCCLSFRVEFHVSKTVFKTCFGIGTCNSRKLKLRTPAAPIFKNCNDLLWFTKTLLFRKYISYIICTHIRHQPRGAPIT